MVADMVADMAADMEVHNTHGGRHGGGHGGSSINLLHISVTYPDIISHELSVVSSAAAAVHTI